MSTPVFRGGYPRTTYKNGLNEGLEYAQIPHADSCCHPVGGDAVGMIQSESIRKL